MELLLKRIEEHLNKDLLVIAISNPRRAEEIRRYVVKPVMLRDQLFFQISAYTKTQVFHENLSKEEVQGRLAEIIPLYRQVQMQAADMNVTALISKKGKAAVRIQPGKGRSAAADEDRFLHNRKKKYILEEGRPVPFLKDLGVMTGDGRIVRNKYDKFRQINRFLEFIDDVSVHLPRDREIQILDFGCGKSYLTFAVYYYLRELKNLPVHIIGLDLKKDVIRKCRSLAEKYGYQRLDFYEGAIEDYQGVSQIDMVITLHACDTATDYALYKAVLWKASVILSVPCCQHELNSQISARDFSVICDHGILKERFAALATDGIRTSLLEAMGYEARVMEFIDMEHTPKNLLIRAVRTGKPSKKKWEETEAFCDRFHFDPTLKRLLERNDSG